MDTFVTRQPCPELAPFVKRFWVWRSDVVRPNGRDRMLPKGTPDLVVNLAEDELRFYDPDSGALISTREGIGFSGALDTPFMIDTRAQQFVAGVEFRPGGAWPFVGEVQHDLANQHVSLRDVWGPGAGSLREELLGQSSAAGLLEKLEGRLLDRMRRPRLQHRAVTAALSMIERSRGAARIESISETLGLSRRRLSRVFEIEVGLSPKRYASLRRFWNAIEYYRSASHSDDVDAAGWANTAIACGYFDQSHLVRDFQRFAGMAPSTWAALSTDTTSHVPIA